MKKLDRIKFMLIVLALLSTPVLAAMTANTNGNMSRSNIPATIPDNTVTSNVQTKLNQDPLLNGNNINVSTHNGVVTLSGHVNSQVIANTVIAAAKSVPGVKNVKSNITVNNAPSNSTGSSTTNGTGTRNNMGY